MSFIVKLNWLIEVYLSVLKSATRVKIWTPFFVYALVQLVLLLILVSYVNPYIHPILAPLVSLLGNGKDDFFSRYPGIYIMLPQVFLWGKLLVGIAFEGLAAGLTTLLFLGFFVPDKVSGRGSSYVYSRWPRLLITWLIITVILLAINAFVPNLFRSSLAGSPRRIAVFDMGLRLLTVLIYSVFIYAVPTIVVEGESVWGALKQSFSYFKRYPVFSFFLTLIPYLLSFPTSFLLANTRTIVEKFTPELVFYILLISIVVDLVINFFLTGAVVKFLVGEKV